MELKSGGDDLYFRAANRIGNPALRRYNQCTDLIDIDDPEGRGRAELVFGSQHHRFRRSFNQRAFHRCFFTVAGGQPFTCMNAGHAEKAHVGAHAADCFEGLGSNGHHGVAKQAPANEYGFDRKMMLKGRGN